MAEKKERSGVLTLRVGSVVATAYSEACRTLKERDRAATHDVVGKALISWFNNLSLSAQAKIVRPHLPSGLDSLIREGAAEEALSDSRDDSAGLKPKGRGSRGRNREAS